MIMTKFMFEKCGKMFTGLMLKLLLSFTVISDVYRSFVTNKTTFNTYTVLLNGFQSSVGALKPLSKAVHVPGARFTNGFLPAIQIRWKLRLAVIPLLAIRSRQIFAHATTAQLSCHVQNFVAITLLDSRWEWNEISIEFEMRWKNR